MAPWPPEGEPSGKGTKPVTLPRPGHADLAGVQKYGHTDVRNSLERASARHTAVHVAAGAVAKALLATIGISVAGSTVDEEGLRARIDEARAERDTVGGLVEVRATRRAAGPRLVRGEGGSPRCEARCGRDGHPGRQGRRDRRRVRARVAARVRGARRDRHRPATDGESRRRDRGRHLERRGDRRAGRDEAAADADEAARLGRPRDGRARRGARRALGRRRGRGARRRRRGGGRLGARGRGAGEVRRRRGRRLRRRASRVRRRASNGTERARPARRADRVHGRGQDDARGRASPSRLDRHARRRGPARSRGARRLPLGAFFAKRGELEFRIAEAAIVRETLAGGHAVGDRPRWRRGDDARGPRRALADARVHGARRGRRRHRLEARARQRPSARAGRGAISAGCTRSASRCTARSPTPSRTTPTA